MLGQMKTYLLKFFKAFFLPIIILSRLSVHCILFLIKSAAVTCKMTRTFKQARTYIQAHMHTHTHAHTQINIQLTSTTDSSVAVNSDAVVGTPFEALELTQQPTLLPNYIRPTCSLSSCLMASCSACALSCSRRVNWLAISSSRSSSSRRSSDSCCLRFTSSNFSAICSCRPSNT